MIKRKRSDHENSDNEAKEFNQKFTKVLEIEERFQDLLSDYSSKFISSYWQKEFNNRVHWLEGELEKLKFLENEQKYLCDISSDSNAKYANLSVKLNKIANKFYKFKDQYDFDLRFIYYISTKKQKKKKYLGIYDTKGGRLNSLSLDLDKNLDITLNSKSCFCQLPNSELFFYNENHNAKSGVCCIIDLKSLSIKRMLPTIIGQPYPSCIYYGNYIYLFAADELKNYAFKFDLLQNKWFKLASISDLNLTTCLEIFKKSILFTSNYKPQIYKYDLEIESYSTINFEVSSSPYKGIISFNSRIYIFESCEYIFESEVDNEYAWQNIGVIDIIFNDVPLKKSIDGTIFVTMAFEMAFKMGTQVYKFDLKSKSFRKVKVIKY